GKAMRLAEVAEMVGRKPKDGSVRNALSALVAEGLLVRDTTGYSKVQTVQTGPIAPLHPAPEAVQSAKALKGDCTLHQDSATAELIRLAGKFPFTEDT
ncbi:MAG: hypothetical protein ACRDK7_02710, partial [Solirubrobacteraceae bacterium]